MTIHRGFEARFNAIIMSKSSVLEPSLPNWAFIIALSVECWRQQQVVVVKNCTTMPFDRLFSETYLNITSVRCMPR